MPTPPPQQQQQQLLQLPPMPPLRPLLLPGTSTMSWAAPTICAWCNKQDSWEHQQGKVHRAKQDENEFLNSLLGVPQVPRPLGNTMGKGLFGRLTQAAARSHWGAQVELFPARAQAILQDPSRRIKLGKKDLSMRERGSIKLSLGFINYTGAGKYGASNRLHRWESIPRGDDGPQPVMPQPHLALPQPAGLAEDPFWVPEELGGWWPVTILNFQNDGEFTSWAAIGWHPESDVIAIICVYQWGWPEPTAWLTSFDRVR
jgi:hypothetical protein